jgi:hypothetical protein
MSYKIESELCSSFYGLIGFFITTTEVCNIKMQDISHFMHDASTLIDKIVNAL